MKIDEAGNIHVLFQSTAIIFVHTAFTPYGVQLFCRTYVDKSNKIYLVSMPNGQISVPRVYSAINSATGEDKQMAGPRVSANPSAGKIRLGRGGLFGPK